MNKYVYYVSVSLLTVVYTIITTSLIDYKSNTHREVINRLLAENDSLKNKLDNIFEYGIQVDVTMYRPTPWETDSTPDITADGTISTDTNGDINIDPAGTGIVNIASNITHTGTQTTTGQLNVDNLRLDGNIISATSGMSADLSWLWSLLWLFLCKNQKTNTIGSIVNTAIPMVQLKDFCQTISGVRVSPPQLIVAR